ncbi:hypothetical protein FA95DRAFT_359361 [Auriscalpium vulgare]|uniref:Uncharacterized protein n=1 Tax=Auriscalpium vulgare TaxID=40419 RepID=A0ACB8S561_9AGAM|nr:hypothetical protein FA95DRAFT_359361 [Auriscalpium vulgare]
MSGRIDSAMPTLLSSLDSSLVSRKLRLLGRILSYDKKTGLVLLCNEDRSIVVDVSLCIPPAGTVKWLVDAWSTVTVIGYLEKPWSAPPVPGLPAYVQHEPQLLHGLLVHAILVIDSPHVDLKAWNATVAEMNAMG